MKKDFFDLSSKVVVVTGGLGLLGLNFVEELVNRGASPHVLDLADKEKASNLLSNRFGPSKVYYHRCSILDKDRLIEIRNNCLAGFGKIDVLINAAALNPKVEKETEGGGQSSKIFEEVSLDNWKKEIDINLLGTMLCCQVFGSAMKQGASIINIASVYALVGPDQSIYPNGFIKPASYSASKGGVIAFTKYLASYWGEKEIRVNCLSFGGVENGQDEFFKKKYSSKTCLKRMAKPDDFNGLIVYLASDASSYMTGENIVIDGGFTS